MMKVITRYLIKEFIKLFIICQIIFLALYLVLDFIEKVDDFVGADVSMGLMILFFLNKTPFIIGQLVPAAAMISVIILFWLMKKNDEIIAVKACGIDIIKVSRVMIFISIFLGIFTFLLTELVIPITNSKSNKIWSVDVRKRDPTRLYGSNQIWYKSADSIYWIKHFDGVKKVMVNPTFYYFDDSFNLIQRIDAKRAIWEGVGWKAEKGIVQNLKPDGDYKLKRFNEFTLRIPEKPDVFLQGVKEAEDMSYWELKQLSEKIRKEGYDNTRYLVGLDLKIAYPFVIVILIITGIPLALNIKKGGAPLAVSIGIFICFIYLFIFGLFRSLGIAGILPPLLSVWAANLIFICFGIYLMMKIER